MSVDDDLTYSVHDQVATITLDRPAYKNSFTFAMIELWAQRLHEAARDPQVGAVVLTGAGKDFCAGVDIHELVNVEPSPVAHKLMLTDQIHGVVNEVERLDKPLIAAINGIAVGAGLDMALMCDMRFASQSARMAESYINVGLVPGDGGCYFLPQIIGSARALEMLLTGDIVEAEEALRIGLVNRVYPDEQLLDRTQEFAARLAHGPRIATGMIKRAVRHSQHGDLRANLDLISSHMGVVMSTDESIEALGAIKSRLARSTHDRT